MIAVELRSDNFYYTNIVLYCITRRERSLEVAYL